MILRLFIALIIASRLATASPLDTVAKVRELSPEEAAKALPVKFEGTVIYYDPNSGDLFVRDDTATTYVSIPASDIPRTFLEPGWRVRVSGVTGEGGYYPVVRLAQIEVIGKESLPPPQRIGEEELFSPSLDSQWVEVDGVVTGIEKAGRAFTLAVEIHGRNLILDIPRTDQSTKLANLLMQRPVRIQGVAGTVYNDDRQMTARIFKVPSFDQIIPTDALPDNPSSIRRNVTELLRNTASQYSLVQVEGVVTQVNKDGFYLRDASGSAMVQTAPDIALKKGDRVIAEGFATPAPFRPILHARKVSVLEVGATPEPVNLDFESKRLSRFQAELISVDAVYLARKDTSTDSVLQCRIGERYFEAIMPPGGTLPENLSPYDVVRLTGICELTTTRPSPYTFWVDGFQIHLPKIGGCTILSHASWWTVQRVLVALALVSVGAFGMLAWAWALRRKVKDQHEIIALQSKHVAVQEERHRIARELHDTVEQELTGLSIQLGNISVEIDKSPEQAHAATQLAQQILRHCRNETRSSIRDLRSIELEQRGLAGALQELLSKAVSESGIDFQMTVSGEVVPLTAEAENHLLRISQEAASNAIHHAKPGKITLLLTFHPSAVELVIADDGCGFDPELPVRPGHFGVLGIRERANKLEASLTIDSAPGKGTSIRVLVPTTKLATERIA